MNNYKGYLPGVNPNFTRKTLQDDDNRYFAYESATGTYVNGLGHEVKTVKEAITSNDKIDAEYREAFPPQKKVGAKPVRKMSATETWDVYYKSMSPIEKGQWNNEQRKKDVASKNMETWVKNNAELNKNPRAFKKEVERQKTNGTYGPGNKYEPGKYANIPKQKRIKPSNSFQILKAQEINPILVQNSGIDELLEQRRLLERSREESKIAEEKFKKSMQRIPDEDLNKGLGEVLGGFDVNKII